MDRKEWIILRRELKNIGISVEFIYSDVNKFYNSISIEWDGNIQPLYLLPEVIDAELHAKTVIRLLKNCFEPERNHYIMQEQVNYNWLIDNLGRVDLKISESRDETIKKVEMNANPRGRSRPVHLIELKRYMNLLYECMNHLAFFPLKRAVDKYKHEKFYEKETEITKDSKLFWYLTFLEYFHSSEAIGAITSQGSLSAPRGMGVVSTIPTKQKYSYRSAQKPLSFPNQYEDFESEIQEPPVSSEFFNDIGGDDEDVQSD